MDVQEPLPVRADQRLRSQTIRYSICTIVTRPDEYSELIASFAAKGFNAPECEFLYVDNTQGNEFDSYSGYNLFLSVARGEFIILCHQDVRLIEDTRAKLDSVLEDLTQRDPAWAACGNSGGDYAGRLVLRITDPHGVNLSIGEFPVKVRSLDENFIVVRRLANLALSGDLQGFHLYGTDLCIIANILGWNCYVVDFHLQHKSPGMTDRNFFAIRDRLIRKYRVSFRSRWIRTTCTIVFLSGLPFLTSCLNSVTSIRIVRFLSRKLTGVSQIVFDHSVQKSGRSNRKYLDR